MHSLNLRQQQKVEDEMQILKKKLKKGILSVCLNLWNENYIERKSVKTIFIESRIDIFV